MHIRVSLCGVEGVIAVIHREDLPHYSWHKILTSFGILGNDGMACQAQLNLSALQLSVVVVHDEHVYNKDGCIREKLKERQIQEWQGYYINYKLMKKKVKQYGNQIENGALDRRHVLKDFSRMLDHQIEKIVLFMLEQQGLIASRIAQLNEQQEALQEEPDISKISDLREAYRAVGQDLLKLLFFVEMNAIGPPGSYLSIYDQPALPLQDPVVDSLKSAADRLTHSTNFLDFLGQHALIMHEELPSPVDDHAEEERYHFMSLLLNLANTFLYMVNTYIIVPTADDYSMSLGAAATVCGVVIGAMAVAQVFSSVYFSAWSNKSYFRPLVFSSIVLFIGNVMYALAYDLNSISVLLVGRIFCGLGSARAVNRRYISDCVPLKTRMQASAGFVSASALGMACGPALAGLLQIRFKIFNITFSQDTLPGWVMAVAWLFYLIWLWISFREPVRETEENVVPQESSAAQNDKLEKGLAQPLLTSTEHEQDDDGDQECDESEEAPEESRRPANSLGEAYRLLTPSVKGKLEASTADIGTILSTSHSRAKLMDENSFKSHNRCEVEMVQLLIYFMLKYAMEILLSESSVVTTYYFGWTTSTVSIFLACLGLTVLPINIVVGSYISNMYEDRQILLASEIVVFLGILFSFKFIIPYSVPQYVISGLVMFVAAEVLEGVNLSLLSRVMSSRLSRGTYNGGLLSTEAGTLARVVADATITLAGFLGEIIRYLSDFSLLSRTLLELIMYCMYCSENHCRLDWSLFKRWRLYLSAYYYSIRQLA
ncbi:hypothetical protein DH2020_028687 [Rehmannia glutinosa]|uniref:SPX domain-containing protein n=1 Tax=Rehmannia glutinosa TaxID=99300 RepID=A0ABR0VQQ0_REHGL